MNICSKSLSCQDGRVNTKQYTDTNCSQSSQPLTSCYVGISFHHLPRTLARNQLYWEHEQGGEDIKVGVGEGAKEGEGAL